ncbi:hypothetical protein CCH79_00006761 [Gambusia affinis]|uniref:DiGeorge syndrome critical region gene 6 n=1 Tax=Gambusia affinis TaxID=33528 RepID=A0A315V948_GAMAF|nr:hypothetical protein CCH79_00006761 [Gambusia affinis]
MDEFPGVTDRDSTKLQERHYYLLSELQTLVKDLPSSFQQRLTYNTLSDLALALIDGTVYEIVQGLLDIQHLTEKNLYNQRQKLHCEHQGLKQDLVRKHKDALQSCKPHNLSLLKTTQQTELEALEVRVREEQKMMDKKIVVEMDQKVTDQQNTLEKAGVPGFYITTNPLVNIPAYSFSSYFFLIHSTQNFFFLNGSNVHQMQIYIFSNHSSTNYVRLQELTMQMNLLELILKLQQKDSQA